MTDTLPQCVRKIRVLPFSGAIVRIRRDVGWDVPISFGQPERIEVKAPIILAFRRARQTMREIIIGMAKGALQQALLPDTGHKSVARRARDCPDFENRCWRRRHNSWRLLTASSHTHQERSNPRRDRLRRFHLFPLF